MSAFRRALALVVFLIAILAFGAARPSVASAASCVQATGAAAHVLCFLDFTGYTFAPGASNTITFTLPDGSSVSAKVSNPSSTTTPGVVAVPTYSGSALGNTSYTGLTGKPAFYGGGTIATTLSNVTMTDPGGKVLTSTTIAGADAESLDSGDGSATTADVIWTTSGTAWSQLQLMNGVTSGTGTPVCTLTGLGTTTAKCVPSSGGNNAAYILSSTISPSQTLTVGSTSTALQGYAFAVDMSTIALAKQVNSRIAAGDQFTVAISRSGTSVASTTTSGTSTTATTGSIIAAPTDTYTMSETAAGTTAPQYYASTYACVNANATSKTVLPSGSGTTFALTPAADDMITCTFTNTAMTLTDTASTPNKGVVASTATTDTFVLTNTSAVAGTFALPAAPTISAGGTAIAPTGYTFNGTTYATLTALQAAINAAGATAAGASITIGVVYTTPSTNGTNVTLALAADVSSGTGTSTIASATETDVVGRTGLAIDKTGTTATSPGGLITYSILVSNLTALPIANVAVSDPVPSGLTITGTPTCGNPQGGATCAAPAVNGNTVSATILTLPAGASLTYTITAAAGTTAKTYKNTATASATGQTTVTSSVTTVAAQANGISKTVRDVTTGGTAGTTSNAVPGDQLEYALTMQNTTGVPIVSLILTDPLPTQTTYVSASCGTLPAGITACAISAPSAGTTGTVTFTYTGTLASGSSVTATIETLVK